MAFGIRRFLFGPQLEELPDVLCGDKKEHYGWIDEGLGCPNCLSIRLKGNNKHKQEQLEDTIRRIVREELDRV